MESIFELVTKHNSTRKSAINLIVSENRLSDRASEVLSSDLASRYAAPFYAGTDISRKITDITTEKAKAVFDAKFANLSPVSGSNSLMAVVFALTSPGDKVGRVPPFFPGGGYPFNYEVFHRVSLPLPFSDENWQLDTPACIELLKKEQPKLVILGASIYTRPMPVQEIADVVHEYGGILAYDGSHSLGLIAGGQYQDPLREGADILFGSTHKTFPGPQGGIILTNDQALSDKVDVVSNFTPLNGPTMTCNPHLARIASLGIVLDEVPWADYAKQIVDNARSFSDTFIENGFEMRGQSSTNYPLLNYSHQVLPKLDKEQGVNYRDKLRAHGIHVDGFMRIGTAEITRLGYKGDDCKHLASMMSTIVHSDKELLPELREEIYAINDSHQTIMM